MNHLCVRVLFLVILLSVDGLLDCEPQAELICIGNYEELKFSLKNNSNNLEAIRNAFYPPNGAETDVVTVEYCATCSVQNETCDESFVFQWMDDDFLLPVDFAVLKTLTFGIADFNKREVKLFIEPFCKDVNEVDELTTITSWLKSLSTPDDSTIIRGYSILISVNGTVANLSPSEMNAKTFIILIFLLLVSSIVCTITLHFGRIKGGLVYNKLCSVFKETEESYEQLVDLMTAFRAVINQSLQRKVVKDKKEEKQNHKSSEQDSMQREIEATRNNQSESDDCKPILLGTTEEFQIRNLDRLLSFENPLPYLSLSTVHWSIVAFIVITCLDIYNSSGNNAVFMRTQWLLSPQPIWAIVLLTVNLLVTVIVEVYICKSKSGAETFGSTCWPEPCSPCQHVYATFAVFCVTSLPLYVIFHGVWLIIVFISFPFRFIPSLVLLFLLVSGGKWLNKNVNFMIALYKEAKRYTSLEQKLPQTINRIVVKIFSVDGGAEWEEKQAKLPLIYTGRFSKLNSLKLFLHTYKLMISLIVAQVSILIIWILTMTSVHLFFDTIQDVSNISDSPLTAILGAIFLSKFFSDVMSKLSPEYPGKLGLPLSLTNCKITKIVYISTRCKSCKSQYPPCQAAALDEDGPAESRICVHCGEVKAIELFARVVVMSNTHEVSVVIFDKFIYNILGDEEPLVQTSSAYSEAELNSIENRLLEETRFNMSLNEHEILSVKHIGDSIYEIVDI